MEELTKMGSWLAEKGKPTPNNRAAQADIEAEYLRRKRT
jgi:hypothetical protein